MTTQTIPTKPADLSLFELHTPAARRQHAAETEAYFAEMRQLESAAQAKAQAIIAEANRTLSEDEYFALAVKRKAEDDAKQAEREAIAKAAALAKIDRLMSSPDTVEVINRSEYAFIQEVIQWSSRGYVMAENGLMAFMPGIYHIVMQAPTPTPTTKKKGA